MSHPLRVPQYPSSKLLAQIRENDDVFREYWERFVVPGVVYDFDNDHSIKPSLDEIVLDLDEYAVGGHLPFKCSPLVASVWWAVTDTEPVYTPEVFKVSSRQFDSWLKSCGFTGNINM